MELLILQPTPFCNLDCSYCYLPFRSDRSRMSLETVREAGEFVSELVEGDESVSLVWHSGEPLVVPPEWYEQAHQLLSEILGADRFRPHFQTNGTLLSKRWTELLQRDRRIDITVSLDGPKSLHDSRRKNRAGRGSHDRVMAGIQLLREAEIPFGCIAVVTASALEVPDALFDFFAKVGPVSLALNPEEQDGSNASSSLSSPEHEAAYRRFLRRIAERWIAEKPFKIRELGRLDAMINRVHVLGAGIQSNQQTRPWDVVSVNWRGDVHTFSPELLDADLPGVGRSLGNVKRDTVASISLSGPFRRLSQQIERGRDHCRRVCDHFFACGGGAPANKWSEHGSFEGAETRYCRFATKIPMDAYLSVLEARPL